MYVYTLFDFSVYSQQKIKYIITYNCCWTSWVGRYYIAFTKTTYYLPTPLFQLARKWPAHGQIVLKFVLPLKVRSKGLPPSYSELLLFCRYS